MTMKKKTIKGWAVYSRPPDDLCGNYGEEDEGDNCTAIFHNEDFPSEARKYALRWRDKNLGRTRFIKENHPVIPVTIVFERKLEY